MKPISIIFFFFYFLLSCEQGKEGNSTIIGNPLTKTAQFLDKNNNSYIRFDEAYTQSLLAGNSIGKKINDNEINLEKNNLSLIDYNQDHIFDELEYQTFLNYRTQIFENQDGNYLCTNEELFNDFFKLTDGYFYFDEFWPGKLSSNLYNSKCLTSSYNQLLLKALEAIDQNKDGQYDSNEFHRLYGHINGYKDPNDLDNLFGNNMGKHFFNLWNMDHRGILPRTLTYENVMTGAILGISFSSWRNNSRFIRQWIKDEMYSFQINRVSMSISLLYPIYGIGENYRGPIPDKQEYPIADNKDLSQFDLNEDGVFNFVDKIGIDYLTHILFLNKSSKCTYTSWNYSIFSVERECEEGVKYIDRDFFTFPFEKNEIYFTNIRIENDPEGKLKSQRFFYKTLQRILPYSLKHRKYMTDIFLENNLEFPRNDLFVNSDIGNILLKNYDGNYYDHPLMSYDYPDDVYNPDISCNLLASYIKNMDYSIKLESNEVQEKYFIEKESLKKDILSDETIAQDLQNNDLSKDVLSHFLK
ncbi:MAG: hypothetical protein H6622_01600 [Halobacteriovoraceae bacterium]|nr:hypothetical protein [Halobacteriovoraceae bacterium]